MNRDRRSYFLNYMPGISFCFPVGGRNLSDSKFRVLLNRLVADLLDLMIHRTGDVVNPRFLKNQRHLEVLSIQWSSYHLEHWTLAPQCSPGTLKPLCCRTSFWSIVWNKQFLFLRLRIEKLHQATVRYYWESRSISSRFSSSLISDRRRNNSGSYSFSTFRRLSWPAATRGLPNSIDSRISSFLSLTPGGPITTRADAARRLIANNKKITENNKTLSLGCFIELSVPKIFNQQTLV